MDHDTVVRQQVTEKYLLNELDSSKREEFEEHYFDCPECAADVHTGSLFVDHAKIVLAEKPVAEVPRPTASPKQPWWGFWLRPALAMPALSLLLVVIGYQNLVTIPQLANRLSSPKVLPFAAVNVGTYGSEGRSIVAHPGEGFLVFVRIPPDESFVQYAAELYDPAEKLEWKVMFPARAGEDEYPVEVPGADWKAGKYTLHVQGVTTAALSKEVGQAMVDVQVQK